MPKKTGRNCLWNWEDLSGETKKRYCYNGECIQHYHGPCPSRGCADFESRPRCTKNLYSTVWGKNNYVQSHHSRKGGKEK